MASSVPLDEQLAIAMANAVDNIAVTHRRMARRLTWIATVSRTLDLDSQLIRRLPAGIWVVATGCPQSAQPEPAYRTDDHVHDESYGSYARGAHRRKIPQL